MLRKCFFLFFYLITFSNHFILFSSAPLKSKKDSLDIDSIVREFPIEKKDSINVALEAVSKKNIEFDSVINFIKSNSDSIQEFFFIHGKNKEKFSTNRSKEILKELPPKDSIYENIKKNIDTIKVVFKNSVGRIFVFKNNSPTKKDILSDTGKSSKSTEKEIVVEAQTSDNKFWIFIVLLFILIASTFSFILFKIFGLSRENNLLKTDVAVLRKRNEELIENINHLENEKRLGKNKSKSKSGFGGKTEQEILQIKQTVIKNSIQQNSLSQREVDDLNAEMQNRWVTVAHSAVGQNHLNVTPPVPCQDNHHFETLNSNWELAIVCDGAGSSKMSHLGSEHISKKELPFNLKNELKSQNWFNQGFLPTKNEWKNLAVSILEKTYKSMLLWVERQNQENQTDYSINDYASTVIVALYNSSGIMVANIGDGRGGYLNSSGNFKGLFTPFGGDESNQTIFITSAIWSETDTFIQTDVIDDKIFSVFLLSDGMEKISFECSNLTDDVFVDANIPYKNFFLPILMKIKLLKPSDEHKLVDSWKSFLESGNEAIKKEGDDKTLLLSFLK